MILDSYSGIILLATQKARTGPLINMVHKLALLYDKIKTPIIDSYIISNCYESVPPYASLESFDIDGFLEKIPSPTLGRMEDLHEALNEPKDLDGGVPTYYGIMTCLLKGLEDKSHFYVLPHLRDGFLRFCSKYQPDYISAMKESFLCFDILDLIFDEQISTFDPEATKDRIKHLEPFKDDFKTGIFSLASDLSGSYKLSDAQKSYVRKRLAIEEQKLLEFLKPENLRKIDVSLTDVLTEIVSMGLSIAQVPAIPLGILVNIAKELKTVHDFSNKQLDFILSIYILKKIASVPMDLEVPRCILCALSKGEIENLPESECHKIALSGEFCERHLFVYLDIRKKAGLFGKRLLLAIKEATQ